MNLEQRKIIYTFYLLLILSFTTQAQDGTLNATVEPAKVAAGEQFQVTFIFSGSDVNSVRNLKAPDFRQFVVLSGPNQSTNMQWINGRISASISYTYALYARQPGKYTIGTATIEYKDKTLKSDPVQVEVTQSKPKQPQKQSDQPEVANIGDNLFIKAIADKQRVRQGEQLTITFKLYTRLSVSGYDLAKAPTFEGFWSEDFELSKQPALTTETVNGKQYRVAVIKKTALFATQAGKLKVAPLEVRCAAQMQSRRRSNDPFDVFFNDPFFQQTQTVNLDVKSNPLVINVDPIPSNAPSGFSGVIGRFAFNANVDKRNVKAGDPITMKLTISGTGNIKLVTLPKPELPADFESYEPKISEDISRDGGVIRGKKTAEYLIIPRNTGQRIIEPIHFTYYDLDQREYVSLRSPRFEFTITPGKDFSGSAISLSAKEDVRMLGEDIRFLKLSIGTLQRANETGDFGLFWLGFVIPPILFIGAWFYRKRMEQVYGDMPKLLFEMAGREASKRLKKAKLILAQGNTESYNAEILRVLTQYLEHKLRTSKADFSLELAIERLKQHGVSSEMLQKLKMCMERAEFSRYAPGADTMGARKELLDVAAEVINGIESMFGKQRKQ